MKNTKRTLAAILAAMTVFSLSACSGEVEETTEAVTDNTATSDSVTTTEAAETTAAEPEITVEWTFEDGTLTFSGDGLMCERNYLYPWDRYKYDIKTIIIEEGVENICSGAFRSCKNLTSVTLPKSLVSIEDYAFSSCSSLTSIEIPETVTFIGEGAFAHCKALTTVKLYANAELNTNIFERCDAITDVTVGDNYVYEDGILYSKDMTVIIACLDSNITTADIRSGVNFIGDYAFEKKPNLTSVTIPDTVTEIGTFAFANCYKLTSATIPSSVTSINRSAFEYNIKLTATIDNSEANVTLGEYAFAPNATVIYTK